MHIKCPNCATNFLVNPEQFDIKNKKVKCFKCKHVWIVAHEEAEELNVKSGIKVESSAGDTKELEASKASSLEPNTQDAAVTTEPIKGSKSTGINLPAHIPINLPIYLLISPLILLTLICLMFVAFFSENFGILSNRKAYESIYLDDIKIEYKKELSKVIVKYKIVNKGDNSTDTPNIRIRLLDKNNRLIQTIIENASKTLEPKSHIIGVTEFNSVPELAKSVDILIGNKIDFLFN